MTNKEVKGDCMKNFEATRAALVLALACRQHKAQALQ
jgi:hypothetical protein